MAGVFIFVACGAVLAVIVKLWDGILKNQTREEKEPAEGKESVGGMVSMPQADRFKMTELLEDLQKRLANAIAEQKKFEQLSEEEVEIS